MSKTIGVTKVSKRYADALYDLLSGNDKKLEKALKDLYTVKSVFESNVELRLVLEHPNINLDDKRNILTKLFNKVVEDEVLNLLLLTLERRRTSIVPSLFSFFKDRYYAEKNIDIAIVSSAKELSKDQLDQIKTRLETIFKKSLELETEIDEKLIAGIRVSVGDQVLDSSVRAKLKQMKQLLTS